MDLESKKTVTVLSIGCILSLVFTTGCGRYLVEVVDSFINAFRVIILTAIQFIITVVVVIFSIILTKIKFKSLGKLNVIYS